MPIILTPPGSAFAAVNDLEALLRRSFTDEENAAAGIALDLATAAIQNYTRQTLLFVADDVVALRGTYGRELVLPERPVVSVASVSVGSTTIATSAYALVGNSLWWGASPLNVGNITTGEGGWGGLASPVTVTYTHGYATIPNDIRGVCLTVAARLMENPLSLTEQSVGTHGQAADSEGNAVLVYREPLAVGTTLPPAQLTDDEKRQLNRYRLRATS